MAIRPLSVTELNNYISRSLLSDPILRMVKVKGEITEFKLHSSGHAYFTIKDDNSKLRCVQFASSFSRNDYMPSDGDNVTVKGRIDLYQSEGKLQFYVESIEKEGIGELYKKFEQLKTDLEKKGYFDSRYKKSLPARIYKIALITSIDTAAMKDFMKVACERNPLIEIETFNTPMQGLTAGPKISESLKLADKCGEFDCIVLTRGGGAYEDLFVFNDENVAKAIFECNTPVISAIGHEIDFTISDFVADIRAITPTHAGQIVSQGVFSMLEAFDDYESRLKNAAIKKIDAAKADLDNSIHLLKISADNHIRTSFLMIENAKLQLSKSIKLLMDRKNSDLELLAQRLDSSSPLRIFNKGYARIYDSSGNTVSSVTDITENFTVRMKDGSVSATLEGVIE